MGARVAAVSKHDAIYDMASAMARSQATAAIAGTDVEAKKAPQRNTVQRALAAHAGGFGEHDERAGHVAAAR